MYNDKIKESIIDDLGSKVNSIVTTAIVLASQGYLVNKSKYVRLDWSSILIHAFENIDILKDNQKHSVELIYNKLATI